MSLEGRLEDMGLPDIFQIISLSKRSGVLTIVRKEGTGRLVFNHGQLVFASSDSKSRLGYDLIKKGLITTEELEKALRVQKAQDQRVPLGTILKNHGAITPPILEEEIKEHLVEVVRDILTWNQGYFHFELGAIVHEEVFYGAGAATDYLIIEATRRNDEDHRDQTSPPEAASRGRDASPEGKRREEGGPGNRTGAGSAHPDSIDATNGGSPMVSFSPRKDLLLLNPMIEELSSPFSSSEITLLVLRFASELMARAVIFLVRKDDILGLGQFGLTIPSPDERIRGVRISLHESSIFREVVARRNPYKGHLADEKIHREFLDQIGGAVPLEVFIAPIISEGRVIALLYGDNLPAQEKIMETEGLEAFIKVAGFAFEKAILERKLSERGS